MTQATPTAATIEGVRQVVFFTKKGLVSVEPKTGAVLWRFPFKFSTSTAISPVVGHNMVYCSNGYGVGSAVAKITKDGDGFHATQLWKVDAKTLNSHWSTPVYKDGYLYGLFGFKEYAKCPLKCVEMATGKTVWSEEGFRTGRSHYDPRRRCSLCPWETRCQLVLADASPMGYAGHARFEAVKGKCWNRAVVSNGRIYARSTKEGVCLDVSGRTASR